MLKAYPNVKRWFDTIMARPAVQKALTILAAERAAQPPMTPEAREIMFGSKQYERR
jgi:GST-like protein